MANDVWTYSLNELKTRGSVGVRDLLDRPFSYTEHQADKDRRRIVMLAVRGYGDPALDTLTAALERAQHNIIAVYTAPRAMRFRSGRWVTAMYVSTRATVAELEAIVPGVFYEHDADLSYMV